MVIILGFRQQKVIVLGQNVNFLIQQKKNNTAFG